MNPRGEASGNFQPIIEFFMGQRKYSEIRPGTVQYSTGFQIPLLQIAPEGTPQNKGGNFSEKKKRLRQRTHKLRASRNMGAIFLEKKGACGNVPTSSGLPKIWDQIPEHIFHP